MPRRAFACLFGLVLGLVGAATGARESAAAPDVGAAAAPVQVSAPTLGGQIDAVLAQPFLAPAQIGVHVVDLANGETLYERNAELALNPASNVKLATTAAALAALGPAFRYTTRLYHADATADAGTIDGDLWLRGGGDPGFVTEDLYAMVADLRARGYRRITGGVVVDSRHFDRDELPPGFDQKEELASYRAMAGATSLNFNTFVVRARPGERLDVVPYVAIDPPVPSIELVNEAITRDGHLDRLTIAVDHNRRQNLTKVTVRGTLGVDAGSQSYRYPVADPSRYAGEVLAMLLRQRGFKLGRNKVRLAPVPPDGVLVGVHHSAPLSVLIRAVNKHSNNFMAEQILKSLAPVGEPASFAAAIERERRQLLDLGLPPTGVQLSNGSGLYDTNRMTAAAFTSLLAAMHADFRVGSDFMASLAIMGVDGTTRSRLQASDRRGYVRAKTGTLDGVYCLSGYAGAPGRDPVAFSILFNGLTKADASMARDAHNRIAELIARHAAGEPLVTVTEPPAPATLGSGTEGD